MSDILARILLAIAFVTATIAAPRSASERAPLGSGAEASATVPGPVGASRLTAATHRPSAMPAAHRDGRARRGPASPRPTHPLASARTASHVLVGTASWYCLPGRSACTRGFSVSGAYAAAGPAIRAALGPSWRGSVVVVSTRRASVTVRLVDVCACPGSRLLDLYAVVYGQLDSLGSGLLDVSVSIP